MTACQATRSCTVGCLSTGAFVGGQGVANEYLNMPDHGVGGPGGPGGPDPAGCGRRGTDGLTVVARIESEIGAFEF